MTAIDVRRFVSAEELDGALVDRLRRALTDPAAARSAVMLSGGHTPLPAYRTLAEQRPRAAAGVHVLYSDDRYVPADSTASNYFQSRALIDALALPEEAVLRVRTELPLLEATRDFEQRMAAMLAAGVRITLGLLGLGTDGHTASLFTPAHLEQARGHLALAVQRPDGLQGVSVTPELLSKVAEPLFLVAGADKQAVIEQFLRPQSNLTARRAVAGCARVELWIAAQGAK